MIIRDDMTVRRLLELVRELSPRSKAARSVANELYRREVFVCYHCFDNEHEECVGVPCMCTCEGVNVGPLFRGVA